MVAEPWSADDARAFEDARELLLAVVAAYSERLGRPGAQEHAAVLQAELQRFALQRRELTVYDRTEIARVLRDYPVLLRALRAGA